MTSKILNPKDIAETLTMLGKGTALLQSKNISKQGNA